MERNDRRVPATDAGFSLIELLAVVALMGLLIVMVVPSVGGIMGGARLTQTGNLLVDEINQAHMLALARSKPCEVWFLRMPSASGGAVAYRGFRSRLLEPDGSTRWVTRLQRLPEPLVISPSAARSNSIGGQTPQSVTDAPGITGGVGIRIYPNGRAEALNPTGDLDLNTPLFFTIGKEAEVGDGGDSLPSSYITIQVLPRNARVTLFRP